MKTRLLALSLLALPLPLTAGVQDDLNDVFKGRWVVVGVAVASDCGAFYTDNEVRGRSTVSKGDRQFAKGELARVHKVDVRRTRIDVLLDLADPVLLARREGPFTLYDERGCRVQLEIPVPDEVIHRTTPSKDALSELLELHPDRASGEGSAAWNHRRREAYPADYQKTLAAYGAWKATQVNAAVQAQLDRAADEARRVGDRIRRDPDYLDGFAVGVELLRSISVTDCGLLTQASFVTYQKRPPSSERSHAGDKDAWDKGCADGQRLAFALHLLRYLPGCFVPVP